MSLVLESTAENILFDHEQWFLRYNILNEIYFINVKWIPGHFGFLCHSWSPRYKLNNLNWNVKHFYLIKFNSLSIGLQSFVFEWNPLLRLTVVQVKLFKIVFYELI